MTSPEKSACCPVVELRQYMLHPGKRDVLIDLFERQFVETQEAVGIAVIGQFRDLADPNRFVWLRGFPDMQARAASLSAFYHGAHWLSRRDAANACIVDNDDVSYEEHRAALSRSVRWSELSVTLMRRLKYRSPEVLRLSPASRSLVRA
jgi:hypothetical protein